MGTGDGVVEIDCLERHLLSNHTIPPEDNETEDGSILYRASFQGMENNYVNYQTAKWVLYSLLLILAWGIGLIMLLYLPVRRYVLRKEFRSRKLYVTSDAIVYKVTKPVLFPCFGVLKKEKHVLLPSMADIVIEQGYLQSLSGVYSIRIENSGVRRPASDDVQIQGIAHPGAFRKAVLTHVSNLRSESFSQQIFTGEEMPFNAGSGIPQVAWVRPNMSSQPMSPSRYTRQESFHSPELVLQKLEEVGSSVKRVESLIAEQRGRISEPLV